MSSIYDALKRVQNNDRSSDFLPLHTSPQKKRRIWMLVLAAVVFSSSVTSIVMLMYAKRDIIAKDTRPAQAQHTPKPAPHLVQAPIPAAYEPAPSHNPLSPPAAAKLQPQQTAATATPPAPAEHAKPSARKLLREARAANKAGKTSEAIELYRKAISASPKISRDAYVQLGTLYFNQNDYAMAKRIYRLGLNYFKNNALLLNNMGCVLLATQEYNEAVDFFQNASNYSPDYVEPVYNLACSYAKKGDIDAARKTLNKALMMHPDVKNWAAQDPDLVAVRDDGAVNVKDKGVK